MNATLQVKLVGRAFDALEPIIIIYAISRIYYLNKDTYGLPKQTKSHFLKINADKFR